MTTIKTKEKRCKFSYHNTFYSGGDKLDIGWWCAVGEGQVECNGFKKDKVCCPYWNKTKQLK